MRANIPSMLLLAFSFQVVATEAMAADSSRGFAVNATRVVFEGDQNAATLSVTNHYDKLEYLVQSWVDDGKVRAKGDKGPKAPFLITPPLFRLPGNTTNEMRIVRTGGNLPEDRESIFWINVKFIPKSVRPEGNVLSIAVKNRLKLFYRPAAIVTKEGNLGYEKLTFRYDGSRLQINNPSPYFVTLSSLTVNGKKVKEKGIMVPPKTEMPCPSDPALSGLKIDGQNHAEWRAINDYGAITKPLTVSF